MIHYTRLVSSRTLLLSVSVCMLTALFAATPIRARDPVLDFIIAADSISSTAGETALYPFVAENSLIVGAAVQELLDVAIMSAYEGREEDEKENLDLAMTLSRILAEMTGKTAPFELASLYRSWTPEQRDTRRRAAALCERAADARKARDLTAALEHYEGAFEIYTAIGDRYGEAVLYGSLGVLWWTAGDFDSVQHYYRRALSARRAVDNSILEGMTLNGLGSTFLVQSRFDSAASYYKMAIDLRRRTGDAGGLATSLSYLGNVYLEQGRLAEAKNTCEEAARILQGTGDLHKQIERLNLAANLYFDMGRLSRSNETYRAALEKTGPLYQTDPELAASSEIAIRMNIALNLMEESRFGEAMQELDDVRVLLKKYPDPIKSAEFARNLGRAYCEMGELDHARDNYLLCIRAAAELGDSGMEMEALINIGYLYMAYGAPERGLAFADSALSAAGHEDNQVMLRSAHVLSAELRTAMGDYDSALEHWLAAHRIDANSRAEGNMIADRLGMGNVRALKGECARAREIYMEELPRIRRAGLLSLEEPLWFGVAHTYEEESPDSARFYYEKALAMMEKTGFQTSSAELGRGFQACSRFYYEEVARFYAGMAERTGDDHWSRHAFRTIERSKARGLLDMLQCSIEKRHTPAEEAVLDSIYSLDPASPSYRADMEGLERRYRVLKDERIGEARGKLSKTEGVAELRDIRKALPRKTAVFSYALGDSVSLLWVIDRDGHELHRLPGRRELDDESKLLVQAIGRPGAGDAACVARARRLYEILIAPGEKRLEGVTDLVIVPDGCLFRIPFEALLSEQVPPGTSWDDMPFLFTSYNTVYAPSASCFLKLRSRKYFSDYDIALLAVGDPDYAGLDTGSKGKLRPLPGTREEVGCIGIMFGEDERILLTGASASESELKRNISAHPARLIHIAAHGIVDPVTPTASSIALCAAPGTGEDGYLHTLEILALPLDARLVVLSACGSGTGTIGRGEGVVGLSRAFLCAGASAVISSLWSIPDESTAILMESFYSNMTGKEISAVRAMRMARGRLLETEDYSHPFHWASFIATGTEKAPW